MTNWHLVFDWAKYMNGCVSVFRSRKLAVISSNATNFEMLLNGYSYVMSTDIKPIWNQCRCFIYKYKRRYLAKKKGKRKVQRVPQSQPFSDPKRKRKPTNPNKHKSNKRTKSTKISSLFPKRGNRNTKRTEKHKNKMTHGKTYNKSPRRINQKTTKSKTNTGTTALEWSVE